MDDDQHSGPHAGRQPPVTVWVLAAGLALVAALALTGPLELHGDGREYVLQTQSLVFDGRLSLDTAARKDYWNRTNPYGEELGDARPPAGPLAENAQAGGGFGGLYPDRSGRYRFCHFWLYSLLAAPLYALFHALAPAGGLEYHAFRVLNTLCLLLPFGLAWRRGGGWPLLAVSGLALLSPLPAYVDWPHPELMCAGFVLTAFWLTGSVAGRWAGALLLGAAAAQNVPILFFFVPYAWLCWQAARPARVRSWLHLAAVLAVGAAVGLAPFAYFQHTFGVRNLIEAIGGASTEFMTAGRVASVLFSPLNGALWLMPVPFLFLWLGAERGRRVFALLSVGAALLAIALATATRNLNAGQVGPTRYVVWALAPGLWLALDAAGRPGPHGRGWRLGFTASALVAAGLVIYFQTYELAGQEIRKFGGCWRARDETARLARVLPLRDDPEVVAENVLGRELPYPLAFNGIYIWNLGRGRSLWIVSRRALRAGNGAWWPATEVPAFRSYPPGRPFVKEGAFVRLDPARVTAWRSHPVLGDYLELRVRAEIRGLVADAPAAVR